MYEAMTLPISARPEEMLPLDSLLIARDVKIVLAFLVASLEGRALSHSIYSTHKACSPILVSNRRPEKSINSRRFAVARLVSITVFRP